MQTRRNKAGLLLGATFLMIPSRWAAAAWPAPAAPPSAPAANGQGGTFLFGGRF
jgi:hypothetical protein